MRLGHTLRTLLDRSRLLLLLALAIACPHAAAAQSDVISSGTAFFINADGWLVTNAHVLEGCQRATVPSHSSVAVSTFTIATGKDMAGGADNVPSGGAYRGQMRLSRKVPTSFANL